MDRNILSALKSINVAEVDRATWISVGMALKEEGYGSGWRKVRDRYISAHPLCEECLGLGRASVATLVHHVKPIADGGTNDESNLRSLCVSCHEKIHRRRKSE